MNWKQLEDWIVEQGFAADEYFERDVFVKTPQDTALWDGEAHWIAVYWVVGASEGYYVHVERIVEQTRELVLLGKFWKWQRAEEAVRAIQRKINELW